MAAMAKKATGQRKANPYAKAAAHRARAAKPVAFKAGGIQDRAMLFGLTVRRWHIGRTEEEVGAKVAEEYKAHADQLKLRKNLIAKQAISELRVLEAELRSAHHFLTLPWGDDGYRILSSAGYMTYVQRMNTLIDKYNAAADALVAQYDDLKAEAKNKLGDLYDETQYPSKAALRSRYVARITPRPIPAAEDFRVELDGVDTESIRAAIKADMEKQFQDAHKSIWERLKEVLEHAVERMKAYGVDADGKKTGRLHESLVVNIRELLEVVPILNVMGDQNLTAFAARIQEEIAAFSIDTFKEDASVRNKAVASAEDILAKMGEFLA